MSINVSDVDTSALLFVLECCSRLHASGAYAECVMRAFNKMTEERKTYLGVSTKSESGAVATFSYLLYRTLINDGYVISIDEICRVSGCSRKKLWKIARKDDRINSLVIKPSQILRRYLNLISASKDQVNKIMEKCHSLESHIGHSPKTIVAFSMYDVLKGLPVYISGEPLVKKCTIKRICTAIGVTPTCIFRLKRTIENEKKRRRE